ncbi:efflux RND transporter periplasmic adaptor subunit [Consotaella salsifontis]|uniref:RND family efflux transporter, MFP subunit n=1 Tax=Consotaella salsifontis TaxID=1365950 RepID=A0A1T4NT29_9HYPH|nr:efflux RND transporter periplasmic adaptor subunit [Consotaella salsifontis]SJZ82500.1 RND family efflux transporter, MFP subunit [Consotaella salsifontis]
MNFVKQVLVTLVVLAIAGILWVRFDERAASLIRQQAWLPNSFKTIALIAAPKDDAKIAGATPADEKPKAGGAGRSRGGRGQTALVVVDAVTEATTRSRLRAIGSGEAQRSVAVYPDVSGFVAEVAFSSGAAVQAGEVLVVLEKSAEELALDRARIALSAAQDKLGRYQRLASARTTTAVEVADVEREVENARLDLRSAEIALAKRTIRAPISGRVGIADIDVGDLVSSQTLIATIDDRARLKVVFYVPESFVSGLSIGQTVEAVSVANPAEIYRGEVSAIDSRLDQASRTVRVEATMDNPKDELRPGMSFALTLLFPGDDYLSVDPLAIQWERAGPFVWKLDGDTPQKTPVRIIERNVDRVLVAADDLQVGDPVVVEGQQSIRPGGKVTIQETPHAAPSSGDASPQPAEANNGVVSDARAETRASGTVAR